MHAFQDDTLSVPSPRGVGQNGRGPQQPAPNVSTPQTVLTRVLLLGSLLTGAISHGYHLFLYPLYITDEGIYMERAWSVLREGLFSPYTYYYDHAPAGWLVIASWVALLPHQFEAFGNAINTGRVLMLLVHLVSGYLLYSKVRPRGNYRFALSFWFFGAFSIISLYFLYAVLKNELLPAHLSFNLNQPPAAHVSLLYTIWQQLHRAQGGILDLHSLFWTFSLDAWLPKDTFLLAGGAGAMLINLYLGLRDRKHHQGELIASLLALSYIFYLVRGSVMLEFYVVPLVPFLAMNIAMLVNRLPLPETRQLGWLFGIARTAILAVFFAVLLLPAGGYLLVHDQFGKVVPHDLYKLPLTPLQEEQLTFIRQHIPPSAHVIMDDDLWLQLHDVAPVYPWAHSHWNASGDPAVRDKYFGGGDWHSIDYIVMSNKMLIAMQQNDTDRGEDYILLALQNAKPIWQLTHGGVSLAIYQVQK